VITNRIIFIAIACTVAVGCGGNISAPRTAPVSGIVMVKGKPVAGVKVTFHPQFDMGKVKFTPSGETGKDGRFTLSTAAPSDGAPPGDYLVTFELLRGGCGLCRAGHRSGRMERKVQRPCGEPVEGQGE
jgi:hypothetical protein